MLNSFLFVKFTTIIAKIQIKFELRLCRLLDLKLPEIKFRTLFLAPSLIDHPSRVTGPANQRYGWQYM